MTSLNSFSTKRRNRRGTTSPPLVNIHSNPGPKQPKKGRKVAKRSLDRHFGEKEKEKAQELINENASIAEISRQMQIQEDTARRWKRRYIETDLMGTKKSPGRPRHKRSRQNKESLSPQRPQPRPIQKRKKLEIKEIAKVEAYTELNLSCREIAEKVKCGKTTAANWKKRIHTNQPLERKTCPGSGARRKTTKRDDRHYKLAVARDADVFAAQAAEDVRGDDNKPVVSSRTVQKRLHEQRMKTKKKVKKPAMTPEQMRARLAWAKKHRRWTPEQWRRVLWLDESPFTLWPPPMNGKVWVHDLPGLQPRQIEGTKMRGGGHVTVWGCFSASGVGTLKRCTGTMNGDAYHTILVREVLPELQKLTKKDKNELVWLFQHDNASVHMAEQNKKYLKRKSKEEGFKVLEWPSQSPDLNPIENLWSTLKANLKKRKRIPRTLDEVWAYVLEEWGLLKKDLLQGLADSMQERCEQVIAAHGGPTGH